jgi:hypothetical protein
MKFERILVIAGMYVAAIACSWLTPNASWGQKPPPPANPQAPTINPLVPAGVQRGLSLDLVVTGTQLASPTGVSLGTAAKITILAEDKGIKPDAGKFKVRIEVPADTPVGWYPFRVATLKGVSNLRVLCVDDLPQVVGTGNNRTRTTAQEIPVPSAVTGSILAEQGDYYKFTVKAGQRLSFDCQARRIGSAIDAYMYVYDAKSMRELAYDNDSPGCQTDPRISYTFKEAGEYILEVKDVLNRGGPEFFYRVRIGDFPLATTPIPMAAKRGAKGKVGFAGPAVDGVAAVDVDLPSDPAVNVVWVSPKGPTGLHGWPVPLMLSDHDEAVAQPSSEPKTANRVAVPGGITGRFPKGGATDYFVFAAKKGQKLAIEASTLEVFSPTLVYMALKNAKGAEIGKTNPALAHPADQRIDFTAADDGDYSLEVQHLSFAGGPSESYRITVRPATNGFELVLPNERFDVAPNGATAIPVQVVRKGYTGPIELSLTGRASDGISGKATIKAGQNAALLLILARADMPMGAYQFHIVGKATVDGKPVAQTAGAKGMAVQSLNGLPYPPMHLQTYVALAVKEKAPFSLAIKIDPPEGAPGTAAKVTITATRDAAFDDEITLAPPTGLPATIPPPKTVPAIAKGKTETSFPLDLNAKTPLGEYFVLVTAKTKFQGKEYSGAAPPLLLVLGLPFDLQVEPATISLSPGGKAKVKVTAVRKAGYKGPIALDVRNLPAGVTAAKAPIIPADKNDIEVEIAADAKAAPTAAVSVTVGGTATALNNLQNVSPAFSVSVQKK